MSIDLCTHADKETKQSCTYYWTAGYRENRHVHKFVWKQSLSKKDVKPMTYTKWLLGQPDFTTQREWCMQIGPRAYQWEDSGCANRRCFICERKA